MKVGKRILVAAAFAALATFVLGATSPVAGADSAGPIHPTNCTWTVDKTATAHGSSTLITSLDLQQGQTITVDYKVVVTRSGCDPTVDLHEEGGSAGVFDSYAGQLGPDHLFLDTPVDPVHPTPATATFTYSRDITASDCHSFDVTNTVTVVDGNPDLPFASDSLTIHVNVHCAPGGGCTLTQGYWKTHSVYGPAAKPDPTWNLLPGGLGPDTVFFKSTQTWVNVFKTPVAGNQYYSLAHQYMAAKLNILAGASAPSSVTSAITAAEGLFNTYTPAQIGALKGSDALRKQFVSLAGTLGSYNEGQIGPGHCTEDSSSDNS